MENIKQSLKNKEKIIPFYNEINSFLKEIFKEDWMNEDDWVMFLEELKKQTNISIQSLSNDLQIGLKNGYSLEQQFNLAKITLMKTKTL